jgi:hypothetical protein
MRPALFIRLAFRPKAIFSRGERDDPKAAVFCDSTREGFGVEAKAIVGSGATPQGYRWQESGMSDAENFEPPEPGDRPICSNCGWTMWIARIEQHAPGHHKHTLKCTRCDNEEELIVKL